MKKKIALTAPLKKYLVAVSGLGESTHQECMGFVRGESGAGKTTATAFVVNRVNGVFVRAQRVWSITSMLAAIVEQLEGRPQRQKQPMFDYIVAQLAKSRRSLFIDEADYLTTDMIEVCRDIHDISGRPVVLIGDQEVRNGLVDNKRFRRRITEEIVFLPLDMADTRAVYEAVSEIEIEDGLLELLNESAGGNVGLICNGIEMLEKLARSNGWDKATLALWNNGSKANREFFFANRPK